MGVGTAARAAPSEVARTARPATSGSSGATAADARASTAGGGSHFCAQRPARTPTRCRSRASPPCSTSQASRSRAVPEAARLVHVDRSNTRSTLGTSPPRWNRPARTLWTTTPPWTTPEPAPPSHHHSDAAARTDHRHDRHLHPPAVRSSLVAAVRPSPASLVRRGGAAVLARVIRTGPPAILDSGVGEPRYDDQACRVRTAAGVAPQPRAPLVRCARRSPRRARRSRSRWWSGSAR